MSKFIDINDANFESEVTNSSLPVLIDFWAPWCGPCLALMPALEALAPAYEGRLKIVKLNVDENDALRERFNIRGIPALFLHTGNVEVKPVKARTRTRLEVELDELLG